ncbi:hypothetical protein ZHAS_00011529 [Anopheles sinensis]|uniref:Uncharacterized protein n=1 Tax=Anopheles sinensis TaxID=74873 RepID=A0A084W048_ANOSI|nr:hypothetical protein ZHAS_00011529 [Anopheles sinensis]
MKVDPKITTEQQQHQHQQLPEGSGNSEPNMAKAGQSPNWRPRCNCCLFGATLPTISSGDQLLFRSGRG